MTATVLDGRAVMEAWLANGEVETPPHSNCNDITHDPAFGFCAAWCCMTWWEMLRNIGIVVPKQAAVGAAIQDAQAGRGGLLWLPRNAETREGDAWCFDWRGRGDWRDFHIAAWVRDPGTQAKVRTIAGNESDRVMTQWRDRTYLIGIIRPPFRTGPSPEPTQEDDEMAMLVHPVSPDPDAATTYLRYGGKFVAVPDGATEKDLITNQHVVPNTSGGYRHDMLPATWEWLKKHYPVEAGT